MASQCKPFCSMCSDDKDEEDARWNDVAMRSPIPPFMPRPPSAASPVGRESSFQERPMLSLKTSRHDFLNLQNSLPTEVETQHNLVNDSSILLNDKVPNLHKTNGDMCECCVSLRSFLSILQASQERIERTLHTISQTSERPRKESSEVDASGTWTSFGSKEPSEVSSKDFSKPHLSRKVTFDVNDNLGSVLKADRSGADKHSSDKLSQENTEKRKNQHSSDTLSQENTEKRKNHTKARGHSPIDSSGEQLPRRETVFADFSDRIKKYKKFRASVELRNPTQDMHQSELMTSKQCSGIPVFSPYGIFVNVVWSPLFFIAILWALVMSPFDMSFHWWDAPFIYKAAGKMVDVFFICDLLLHFNIAIIHDGHLVSDRKEIAIHYAKTWLIIDIIANTPYDWFISGEGKSRKFLKIAKLPKLLRAIRLVRTLKKQARYIGVSLAFAGMFLSAHWFACLWVGVFQGECDEENEHECPDLTNTYAEALSITVASFSGADSWTRLVWPTTSSFISTGRSAWESLEIYQEIVAICNTTTGLFLSAVIFCNVSKAISRTSEAARQRQNMLEDRRIEMKQRKVPAALQTKVEITYRYLWQFCSEKNDMLKDSNLSLDLRRNLAYHMYGDFLKLVPIFAHFEHRILKCLSEKVVIHLYSPGDLLITKGEVGAELFVLHSGSAQPITEDGKPLTSETLKQGSFFGEICFLSPGTRRKASVVCVEICRAMVLTLAVFKELSLEDALVEIRSQAKHNLELAAVQRLA